MAIFEQQNFIQLKNKPTNASMSQSTYMLASAFSIDFYAVYREELEKKRLEKLAVIEK